MLVSIAVTGGRLWIHSYPPFFVVVAAIVIIVAVKKVFHSVATLEASSVTSSLRVVSGG